MGLGSFDPNATGLGEMTLAKGSGSNVPVLALPLTGDMTLCQSLNPSVPQPSYLIDGNGGNYIPYSRDC